MPQKVIDLRKAAIQPAPPLPHEQKEEKNALPLPRQERKYETLAQWRAEEYQKTEYSQYWFIKIGAAAVFLIILGVFTRSYFFIALIATAFIVIVMYAKRPPRTIFFSIDKKGVHAGKRLYSLEDLKSFWISDTEEERILSLETTHLLQPFVRMPLGDINSENVRRALLLMLPEKEHEELLTDQIARKMGF